MKNFIPLLKILKNNYPKKKLDLNIIRIVYAEANLALQDTHVTHSSLEQKIILLFTIFTTITTFLLISSWVNNGYVMIIIIFLIISIILLIPAIFMKNYIPSGTTPSLVLDNGCKGEHAFLSKKLFNLEKAIINNRANNDKKTLFIRLSFSTVILGIIITFALYAFSAFSG